MAGRYCEGKIKMASEKVSRKMVLEIKYVIANNAVMHLSAAIPGGLTPGTYGGIARGLLTFFLIFGPGRGHWTAFELSTARYTGKDRRDL